MTKGAKASGKRSAEAVRDWIAVVKITGGLLGGTEIELSSGTTLILGGHGSGKSSFQIVIRHALEAGPKESESLQRARLYQEVIEQNLDVGRVCVEVETSLGARYSYERTGTMEPAQVTNDDGEAVPASAGRSLLFGIDAFGQNELQDIATDSASQRRLLDRFEAEGIREIESEIAKLLRELAVNALELLGMDKQIEGLREDSADESELGQKLREFHDEEGPDADAMNAAHEQKVLREREERALREIGSRLEAARREEPARLGRLAQAFQAAVGPDLVRGANKALFDDVTESLGTLAETLEKASAAVRDGVGEAERVVEEKRTLLASRHGKQDQEYFELVNRSEAGSARATRRRELQAKYNVAAAAARKRDSLQAARVEQRTVRDRLLAALSALRDKRWNVRSRIADRLTADNSPALRVSISQSKDTTAYAKRLAEALQGQKLKQAVVAKKIVEAKVGPDELARLIDDGNTERLRERTELDEEKAQRVGDALRGTEALFELEVMGLDDLPLIELFDRGEYRPSKSLSPGQRCTALLPIILHQSGRPLLIDQPEDNVDSEYVFHAIVPSLIAAKKKRQILLVTHNANLGTLSLADRVLVLRSDGQISKVDRHGSVDELRDEVVRILEGGKQAYRDRGKRYGL